MHKGYTLNYFLSFFREIPANKWTQDELLNDEGTKACAIGWAGGNAEGQRRSPGRAKALQELLEYNVENINDGVAPYNGLGNTPRKRILTALKNRKKLGSAV